MQNFLALTRIIVNCIFDYAVRYSYKWRASAKRNNVITEAITFGLKVLRWKMPLKILINFKVNVLVF